jgi:hypothetical protein
MTVRSSAMVTHMGLEKTQVQQVMQEKNTQRG